ncbi:MAG: ABC transporter substrate-binding protein [Candidatus Curtissbacteria bacterium]|nr:ABC transporter substrate-binding protein [Candidatus Curtissbacteria bacterium]
MLSLKVKLRRIRFWWHLGSAYVSRYRLRILISMLVLGAVVFGAYKIIPRLSQTNYISMGYVGSYTLETISTQTLLLATQSLTTVDEKDRPVPSLASHWQVTDGGKTYTVFLKDNLKWHDGTQVNANDISIAIKNVQITALNNKSIQFKLPNPIYSFPLALNKPVFKAKSFYGVGEFRIVGIDQIASVVKKISLVPKDKNLPNVDIKFYQTETQALEAVKIGEIKTASVANAKEFENWPNLEVQKKAALDEVVTVFFNNNDPVLSSKDLRQALNFAVNKSEFDGVGATGPISPKNWAYSEQVKRYDYNTSRAKELISKVNSASLKITLSYMQSLEETAKSIKKDWEAVGFEVALKQEKGVPKNFQAFLTTNRLSPDPDQYGLWHSSQINTTNITNYKNVKIDKLLEDARSTENEDDRKNLYFDFQRFLVDDAPAAFLYHPYKYQVTYKNILPLIAKLPK